MHDQVRRFIFENQPVRGHWVHLESAWQELREMGWQPDRIESWLAERAGEAILGPA